MWQPSSPFGFPKKVPCSKLLLKWFNQISTFLFNRLNQGEILHNLWVQAPPKNWTSQGQQNENPFFNRYDVSETDGDHFRFSFYCLIFSFILHHTTRSLKPASWLLSLFNSWQRHQGHVRLARASHSTSALCTFHQPLEILLQFIPSHKVFLLVNLTRKIGRGRAHGFDLLLVW